jgi:hypothetical protein
VFPSPCFESHQKSRKVENNFLGRQSSTKIENENKLLFEREKKITNSTEAPHKKILKNGIK